MDAAASNLGYSIEAHPGSPAVLRLSGDLDACTAIRLEEELGPQLAATDQRLVLDLRDLDFIDSSGIRLLLTLVHNRARQGTVMLVRPQRGVARRALDLVGLARIIPSVDELTEALRYQPTCVEPGAGAF